MLTARAAVAPQGEIGHRYIGSKHSVLDRNEPDSKLTRFVSRPPQFASALPLGRYTKGLKFARALKTKWFSGSGGNQSN